MIEVKHLSHVYLGQQGHEIQALKDINLEIKPGEFLGIVGRNGSGKSTLAKHLNGLLIPEPGEGEVLVDQLDTRDYQVIWQIRQRVGMVFSNPDNQMVAPVVEEDVAFGPENLGIPTPEIRRRIDQSLAQVGMSGYKQRAPHLLSGGQKQRVAISGVLAMEPAYLVLDEPTSMLDPAGRQEVLKTLHQLNRDKGMAVILITHHMEELVSAHRLVLMDKGEIIQEGPPTEIFQATESLVRIGLDVPRIVKLREHLALCGVEVPQEILEISALATYLTSQIQAE